VSVIGVCDMGRDMIGVRDVGSAGGDATNRRAADGRKGLSLRDRD
jgi:hypothetical protein